MVCQDIISFKIQDWLPFPSIVKNTIFVSKSTFTLLSIFLHSVLSNSTALGVDCSRCEKRTLLGAFSGVLFVIERNESACNRCLIFSWSCLCWHIKALTHSGRLVLDVAICFKIWLLHSTKLVVFFLPQVSKCLVKQFDHVSLKQIQFLNMQSLNFSSGKSCRHLVKVDSFEQ